jgi:hypothetical protein
VASTITLRVPISGVLHARYVFKNTFSIMMAEIRVLLVLFLDKA